MNQAQSIAPAAMHKSVDETESTFALKLFGKFVDFSERLNRSQSIHKDVPVYETAQFPWAYKLEKHWQEIRAELDAIIPRREAMPNFQDICADVSNIQNDNNWKTFFLYGYGVECEKNCQQCPRTAELLRMIPGMKTAFFSILSPGKHIPAHRGPYNGVLRYHLGLLVPKPNEDCKIRISSGFYSWREGESLIFDDSYNHEVWNDTSGVRVVLFVDFLRPVRFPARLLQRAIINLVKLTPFIKASQDRHDKWEQKFYNQVTSNTAPEIEDLKRA